MMFIDVNKFKSINDNYGHNEGDVVLMQLSRLLKGVAETFNCFLCRYGGDEFILIKKMQMKKELPVSATTLTRP